MKFGFLLFTVVLAGCGTPKPKTEPHSTPPAKVTQISDELELATVRLTTEADKRLGVTLAPVKRQQVLSRRPYPGIVVVPPQNLTVLTAPVTGTLTYQGPLPLAVGTRVSQGQPLFSFTPLLVENYALGPTQRDSLRASRLSIEQSAAAIQTRINNAKVELDASRIELRRAEQLFEEKVGSRKRVDDARARTQLAQEILDSARREQQTLSRVTQDAALPAPTPVTQVAPVSGTISRVQAASGQSVTAGQPLLELLKLNRLWLRVRIPRSEADQIQRGEPARVGRTQAMPVAGAPTGDPLTSSVDLYFLLEDSGFNPDQRVEVSLPLKGSGQLLVVPSAAVLYDVFGGAWLYVRSKPLEYRRVRILVDFTTDDGKAVLSEGPAVGVAVVVNGAPELFGIEFGND